MSVSKPPRLSPEELLPQLADRPTFLIDYIDGGGIRSRRWVTFDRLDLHHPSWRFLYCFCHTRRGFRSFRADRVSLVIADDGVVHEDVLPHLAQLLDTPELINRGSPAVSSIEPASAPGKLVSRSKDKYELWWKTFKHPAVVAVIKKRLLDLFFNCCFRCGATTGLQIDHHRPRTRGGRLKPGNLVVLCKRCNIAKGNIEPSVWYSSEHLGSLAPLLQEQRKLFDFKWDWRSYERDKVAYFVSLGVDLLEAARIFNDPITPTIW